MMLITLEEAKAHLMMDHDEDDADIMAKTLEASSAVLTYLKGSPVGQPSRDEQGAIVRDADGQIEYQRDTDDNLIIRPEVQAAVKLLLGEFYKNREAQQDGEVQAQWGFGYLPRPVVALLYPLRDPALSGG